MNPVDQIAALELELRQIPHGPRTRERREALKRKLLRLKDELENGAPPSYNPAADPLYAGRKDAQADEPPPSWSELEAEISKCEIVCANCHRIRTASRKQNSTRHKKEA